MVKDAQVASDDLVFKNCTGWDIDALSVVGNNDDGTS